MLWYLLLYLLAGIITTVIVVIIHIYEARKMGCSVSSMNSVYTGVIHEHLTIISFIYGLFIWPIRIIQFISNKNELIETYKEESE